MKKKKKKMMMMVVVIGVAMGQGVEIGAELVLSSRWPLDSLTLCKGLTAPALPAFPGRELNVQARGWTVPMAKNSTPLQGLIFSKSRVRGYGQLGNGL